jgi:tetratricopeptide (TPR) repeat protein
MNLNARPNLTRGGRVLIVLGLAGLFAGATPARAEDQFAVVDLANGTESISIQYRFCWGSTEYKRALKPNERTHWYYRVDNAPGNVAPAAHLDFETGINRDRSIQAYGLETLTRPTRTSDSVCYVFMRKPDGAGNEYIELVRLESYLLESRKKIEILFKEKQYNRVIALCDAALAIAREDASISRLRGLAQQATGKKGDKAVDEPALTSKLGGSPSKLGSDGIVLKETRKVFVDTDRATPLKTKITPTSTRDSAKPRADLDRTAKAAPTPAPVTAPTPVQPTPATARPLPREFEPYISAEAFAALDSFRLGSTVDAAENARLQIAYDKAFDEGRYNDTQEANFIRAIEREPVAALWKMLNDTSSNLYYLPKFTTVQERLDGLRRPLVGSNDKPIYVESDDDLSGLRIAIRRSPSRPGDGGLDTAAILPFRWVKGRGVVSLDAPDNLRVMIRLKKAGEHAMLGMSFSLNGTSSGQSELRPEIYTSPKFGADRFRAASSAVASARGCMDCHSQGFNNAIDKFTGIRRAGGATEFVSALRGMPGRDGFLADARKNGATDEEVRVADEMITRPDLTLARWTGLKIAVLKLWNSIYYANQPYLDDADTRFVEYNDSYGSAWLDAGDFEKAREHFDRAIARNPQLANLRLKRAVLGFRSGQYKEMGEDLDRAIALDSKNAFAYALRCDYDFHLGDYARAKQDAEQALRLLPGQASGHFALAKAEFGLGNYRAALTEIDTAARLAPNLPNNHALRAWVLAASPDDTVRNGAEALRAARQAYELTDGQALRYQQSLAVAHAETGNFAEAVRFQEIVLNDPILAKPSMEGQRKGVAARLELYRKGLPYRDSVQAPSDAR